MFKNENVEKQMAILYQQRDLMKKFRAKMNVNADDLKKQAAGNDDDELDDEAILALKK